MDKARVPTILELAWPTLKVLEGFGGCASIEQIASELAEFLSLSDEILRRPHGDGRMTELEYRAAWARTYLKKIGAVENPSRGVWCITDLGRGFRDSRTVVDAVKNAIQGTDSPPPRPIVPDELPTIHALAWPTLKILKDLDRPASIKQISRTLIQVLQITRELTQIRHSNGTMSEFGHRAHGARTALKSIGAVVEDASNGLWSITDSGRRIQNEDMLLELLGFDRPDPRPDDKDWRDEVLGLLCSMDPKSFIGLCNQVLEESGFRQVEIIDKTGSGDILGSGVARINLVSFHILFQFKRSATPVDDAEIRDLRGAMVGRAEKGLFVTTGKFTDSASQEAVRSGAPVIDLISGTELCDLLKDLELGVSTTKVEVIGVDPEYFRNW